ncbi:hypothetical protein A3J90_04845 [candidate division WOR-1 bacterium RIFOXYC2_FULL_37_10]|uniref:SLH domain-containing protein n=1 Tax=candidate division WOR-1 bacterium RIFOXYB2_FULL_37_13 TaxID=1802579 RepID=A0A1F4SVJ1_UNCSA|nr:MAG: hypothetical protein A2246_05030 [candidate division WOR-1 bacterium RIFOXYA2_FULL_37_7]OGC24452.1 MAG: hypothetical protein A2310_08615 [candidate division WOR-1 bacterium RIFOXYB2_FULL_37_13]OGC35549.1 MAG: hypothetical protein A3J90_04845 [candidate division WOR-1 bacterium RIFOXYC2_FULL_37_10]
MLSKNRKLVNFSLRLLFSRSTTVTPSHLATLTSSAIITATMKKIFVVILLLVSFSVVSWAISADLGEVGVGARPLSLGKAYVGYAQDASAIFLNPAGLAEIPKLSLVSMTGKMLEDITYVSFGISNPTPFMTFGFGFISAATSGIPLTTITTTTTEIVVNQYGATDYSSSLMYFSFAKPFFGNMSFGGNAKIFYQGFSDTSASLEGGSGYGTDLDMGLKWNARKGIDFGLTAQNLLPMSNGGKFTWGTGREEGIPATFKLGSSILLLGEKGLRQYKDQNLLLNVDLEMSNNSIPSVWHAGVEWWINKIFALRGGVDQTPKATEAGVGIENNLTAGVGLKYKGFSFDYAYHQYGEITQNAAHFFSIGFLNEKEPFNAKEMLKSEVFTTQLKKTENLKAFLDVSDNYWAKDPIKYLATLGIIDGYPDNTFRPEQPLTRGELAALLVKAKGLEIDKSVNEDIFADVDKDHWAAPYVKAVVAKKYMSGYENGKFKPWKIITRDEAVVVLSKFAGLIIPETLSANPYNDVKKNNWAARYISAAKNAGLLEYLSVGEFEPNRAFTRAEAAEIISKMKFAKERIQKELFKKSTT